MFLINQAGQRSPTVVQLLPCNKPSPKFGVQNNTTFFFLPLCRSELGQCSMGQLGFLPSPGPHHGASYPSRVSMGEARCPDPHKDWALESQKDTSTVCAQSNSQACPVSSTGRSQTRDSVRPHLDKACRHSVRIPCTVAVSISGTPFGHPLAFPVPPLVCAFPGCLHVGC